MNQPKMVRLMLFNDLDNQENPGGMLCGHCERWWDMWKTEAKLTIVLKHSADPAMPESHDSQSDSP